MNPTLTEFPVDDDIDFYIDESQFFDPIFLPWRSFKAFLTVYDIGVLGYQSSAFMPALMTRLIHRVYTGRQRRTTHVRTTRIGHLFHNSDRIRVKIGQRQ